MTEMTLEEEQAIKDRCQESNEGRFEGGLTIYDCPVCGKAFCIHSEGSWVYKRRIFRRKKPQNITLYMCSYGCSRKYDQVFQSKKKSIVF